MSSSGPLPPFAPVPDSPAVHFLLSLGGALHRYGTSALRLEDLLRQVSSRLGMEARFFSTQTAIFASLGPPEAMQTCLIRVDPGEMDLERLALLDAVADEVIKGELPIEQGPGRVREILLAPARYGPGILLLSWTLAAAAGARLFGGGYREMAVAGFSSLLIGALANLGKSMPAVARVHEPVAAIIASAVAMLASYYVGPVVVKIATLAGLIILLPGLSLTVALTELATRHLISGTGRLMGAGLVFLQLGFGVALGGKLAAFLAPPSQELLTVPALPAWTETVALAVVTLTVSILFRARPRDFGWIALAGSIAYFGTRAGAYFLGQELGAFLGALLLAMGSNALSRLRNRPAIITTVPGIMLLVPGSVGFHSMQSLMQRDVLGGVDTAFTMLLVAVSLAAGLLIANAVVQPRSAL